MHRGRYHTDRQPGDAGLSAALMALLRAWRRQQLKERMAWGSAWTHSSLVFTREDGQAGPHSALVQGVDDVRVLGVHDPALARARGAPVRGVHLGLAVVLEGCADGDVGRPGRLGAFDGPAVSRVASVLPGLRVQSRYGWVAECEARVGARAAQVCHEGNTAAHVANYEGRPERRPLSRVELQALFDTADDMVGQAARSRRKGWLAAFRDATLFKVIYGWKGLRRTEAAMLDVTDFTANSAAPELGGLGVLHVRFGKAMRGSPARRRAVGTVMPWAPGALEQYLTEVRPRYGASGTAALWLTERRERISARSVDDRLALARAAAGLLRPPAAGEHADI